MPLHPVRTTANTAAEHVADHNLYVAEFDAPTHTHSGASISQQAADYTLALADAGTEVEGTKATAQAVTVPPNSTVAFPVGTVVNIRQYGAGQITITPGAGVTLRSPAGLKTRAQYSTASLIKRATDEWVVGGDTAT